ncbi:capsule biosynthesis GfcC family protein [Arsukibacterium perlucidum]|uniref:capsule biosynthesis GfcC family protein n=1 Tax=Arsukibacterium perlucidum TaxID=368811 RepID=UPI00036C0559|nr:capsule biosynthesis GfcC family protein [Arsukibacterium perlucidum]
MMSICRRYGLIGLLTLTGCVSAKPGAAEAVVRVQFNGQSYIYQQPPRLADVLGAVALTDDWYWPASGLYRLDTAQPEQLRRQIIQQLAALKGKWQQDSNYQNSIEQLKFQLQQWQLAERVAIKIDYDLARLKPAANPQFEPGQYLLRLTGRPQHIMVFGLARAERITHYGNSSVTVYAGQLRRLAGGSTDWLYVLQPDGAVIKAGIASWNQQHIELMPGAQLFVPFDTSFFGAEFAEINQAVLKLAKHRVLP